MNVSDVQSDLFSGSICALRKDTYSNHGFQVLRSRSYRISCGDTQGEGLHIHKVTLGAQIQDALYRVSL